jgi:predicted RNA-binding Zn ribbon-like protein
VKQDPGSPAKLAREELSIKFVNTVAWRLRDPVEDRAASPGAMLKWLAKAGLADRPAASRIDARLKQFPSEARSFLKDAAALREAIYELFKARIDARKADPAAVKTVNANLARSGRGVGLVRSQRKLSWQPSSGRIAPQQLLKPVAWSAVNLLMGPRAQKVRQCHDERGCGWLFIDESRAQNRRWCSMGDCGNLAKSRRHYHRGLQK